MVGGIRWTAVKLIIFTLVTIVVTIWLAALIGNIRLFSSPYTITAEFEDATGLLQGDVVKAAGVTVGRVNEIKVEDGMAVVKIALDEGAEIPSTVSAEIRFRNLVGQRMITLVDDGPDASDLLVDGDLIPLERTDPAFDLTVLFDGLRPLIRSTDPEDINIVSRELYKALKGRSGAVEGIFANLADVSDVLAAKDQQLDTLLSGLNIVTEDLAGRDAQLRNTFANFNEFLGILAANREQLRGALEELDKAAVILDRIIEENDERIAAELEDLETVLAAVDSKREDLRQVIQRLPKFAAVIERVGNYGEWGNQHLINVCKDDFGTCGARGTP